MPEEQKKKEEFAHILTELRQELKDWYKEQIELEQAIAGGSKDNNLTGNIWNISTRMKSIQVMDTMLTIQKHLKLPICESDMQQLVKEGGYANFEEMESDLFPKLESVYVAGGFPEKKKEKVNIK